MSAVWMLGGLLFSQLLYTDNASVEYKIKAGYLYNFTKFINGSSDHAETFNLCIAGDDPFGQLIDPIEQQLAIGRPIKLFRFDSLRTNDKGSHCHILFISASIKDKLSVQYFDNTLVVGESKDFIKQSGMIGFINKAGKIKLQINLKTINQSGMKISAKLLEAADVVKGVKND
jgi:hypothetical protein